MRIAQESGFTLVEVIMVIVIMAILAAVAMRSLDSGLETSRIEETRSEMNQLAEAISGNPNLYSNGMRTSFGYVGDVGSMPANLDALTTNPGFGTWRGPYIRSDYTSFADDFKKDAWGKLYAYTGTVTIKSSGGSDTLTRVLAGATSDFTANSLTGVITDAAGNPPGDSASRVRVVLSYPNGSGGTKDSSLVPNSSGVFTFSNCVPIGNRQVRALYSVTADTVQTFVSVFPKSTAQAALRFPGALWAASGGGGGGGGGASNVTYVAGSAFTSGNQNSRVTFNVKNTGTLTASISSIKLSCSKTAYYDRVVWDGIEVINSNNPWPGNNQVVNFNATKNIPAGSEITIIIDYFRNSPNGGGRTNMKATTIDVTFSDGTVVSFTTP